MIVQTLSRYEAAELLLADENANWSREGAFALATWFEELSDEFNTPQEFDRVAMRCDFSQYEDLFEFALEYFGSAARMLSEAGISHKGITDGKFDRDEKIRDFIRERGYLIEFCGGIIVSNF